ncbi:MAG: hypothetical protein H8E25_12245 [Planctomycetes bacterium]|nr:hypothetical protein [Planctomycetota bacterium]
MLLFLTSLCLCLAQPALDAQPLSGSAFVAVQQQDLGEQLKALDKLMRGKDNQASVLEALARLRVTAVVITNQLNAAENPGEDDSKSEMKKIARTSKRNLAKIADNLMGVILHPRRKKITIENLEIWKEAVSSLGQLGVYGSHDLWQIFDSNKKFKDEPGFLYLCLVEIGTTKDYSRMSDLVKLLDNSEFLYIAGAAEAIAKFGDAPGKSRRMAVETLSKYISQYYEAIQSNASDEEAQRKYRITSQSLIKALTALTGQKIVRPLEWTAWWNENKNKPELWKDKDE